nr:isoform 3 of translation initiation factor eif-2b subunit delta [Quercus suber]
MIPPPRHSSDTTYRPVPFPPASPLRRDTLSLTVGSYNNNNIIISSSPTASFYDESKGITVKASSVPASGLTTVSVVKTLPPGFTETIVEKVGGSVEMQNDLPANSKPLKERTSKAERRALQEAQRAAKAAAKAEGSKLPATTSGAVASANAKPSKATKPPSQKNDSATVASSEKKGSDRPPEKDRKKDAPHPRMQYDDKSRVEKAKRRAVVKQTEARNRVELFRHLPQYEHGTQLPDLESKFFQLDPVHPVVYKVGLQYISGDIAGGNARCIAMLQAFQEAIKDYSTPDEKTLTRDLTAKINSYVSFLNECRPLSISMGNAIRFLKNRIAKLPLTLSESEAKAFLQSDIEQFINEKIILADKWTLAQSLRGNFYFVVYSRVGTACVAMVAHEFRVPVLVCCEAYKFHERVQLDSICSNELGDPDAISKVPGREDINYLDGCTNSENLQLLNLIYDATPSDYVSMIVTDYGMVPPTSVPVIVREYCRDQVWI